VVEPLDKLQINIVIYHLKLIQSSPYNPNVNLVPAIARASSPPHHHPVSGCLTLYRDASPFSLFNIYIHRREYDGMPELFSLVQHVLQVNGHQISISIQGVWGAVGIEAAAARLYSK
jgi:hypothetical protein